MSQIENDSITPKYHSNNNENQPQPLGSPIHEMSQPFGIQSAISSPILHHSSSNGSMAPPYSTPMTAASSITSPSSSSLPGSPTRDDARRALDTLLNFFSQAPSGFVNENEYMTVVKLTEKLRLQQGQGNGNGGVNVNASGGRMSENGTLPGGLHRIVEQEGETGMKIEGLDENGNEQIS